MKIRRVLPNRQSFRLSGYNYTKNGIYFITLCEMYKRDRFGNIDKGKMIKSEIGKIIEEKWLWLQERYSYNKSDQILYPQQSPKMVFR